MTQDTLDSAHKRIGWFCSYVPEEMIIAAGLVPMRIQGRVDKVKEADSYVFSNICPYLKNILDSGLRGNFEDLAGLIFTNSCDGMRRLYDLWTRYVPTPFTFMLEVPRNRDERGVRYFASQLLAMKAELEKAFERDIPNHRLLEAVSFMNDRRDMVEEVFSGQKEFPPRLKGSEVLALGLEEMTRPKAETTPRLEEAAGGAVPADQALKNKPRILVMGNVLDRPSLFEMVEGAGASVVVCDTCNGLRHYSDRIEDGDDPIEALARRYLHKPPCPRMPGFKERMDRLGGLIEDYSIGGVIYSNLKYCDYSLFETPQIEGYLKERRLPFMVLENDYLWADVERMRIRVEAFLEVVGDVL